ncbi:MAG: YdeI/OmpD-associated family protein [Bacteroidia bacterium]
MAFKNNVKFSGAIERFGEGIAYHYIAVPEHIALSMAEKFPHRVFCTIRNVEFPAAIIKHGAEGFVIQMGLQTLKKFAGSYGEVVEVKLIKDTTEHGYPLSEEFAELLSQDEEGRDAWESLNPGAKRSFLYYLSTGKSVDTRIKRGLIILQRAREIKAEKAAKARKKG